MELHISHLLTPSPSAHPHTAHTAHNLTAGECKSQVVGGVGLLAAEEVIWRDGDECKAGAWLFSFGESSDDDDGPTRPSLQPQCLLL